MGLRGAGLQIPPRLCIVDAKYRLSVSSPHSGGGRLGKRMQRALTEGLHLVAGPRRV